MHSLVVLLKQPIFFRSFLLHLHLLFILAVFLSSFWIFTLLL
jgi:hypothetical protein